MPTSPDFQKWLAGLGAVEEDHIFIPIGAQSHAVTLLHNERAQLLAAASGEEDIADGDKAIGESFTESLADLDARIAAQIEEDHPEAPRLRLRGLSDDDLDEIRLEVSDLAKADEKMTNVHVSAEINTRTVHRAIIIPAGATLDDIKTLRKTLNRGEWARLLSHVMTLADADAEAASLPN